MYVTELRTEGLRYAPDAIGELERVVRLPVGAEGVAIADALTLFAVGLASPAAGLEALSWGHPLQWIGEGPVEVHGLQVGAVDAAVAPRSDCDGLVGYWVDEAQPRNVPAYTADG
ncbi:MAG: hypothetical protein AAGA48_34745, partial [Myxococcota bacterium]